MELIKVDIQEISELQEICTTSYSLNFADHWIENGLEMYLEQEFATNRLNLELEKIYILPNYSGMGIGKMAMAEIVKLCIQKRKELLFLCVIDTNNPAIKFYEKLGFGFHSKTRLDVPNFRNELRGMNRMYLGLDRNTSI